MFVNGKMTYLDLDRYLTGLGYHRVRTEPFLDYRHNNGSIIQLPKGPPSAPLMNHHYFMVRLELRNFGFEDAAREMALVD